MASFNHVTSSGQYESEVWKCSDLCFLFFHSEFKRFLFCSGRVDDDGDEVDDLGYDARLARQWKQRRIAYQDFKLNYGGKLAPVKRMGTSGDELIENESANDDAYNNNDNNACSDMDPQHNNNFPVY
ncbi:hypothetical protein GH714_001145 [Hevea brasiliensis]|uniref:Uncharacterized protein n=1 Tax=Hevea brasiliensis TaxID=3981 RepID=A0A6A6LAN5_HEVBR|nr:hypothetical protein GH714_001145 [Hevea brasiliensis]